jgi:uncharacterized protein YbjQ (UPF0145 family)
MAVPLYSLQSIDTKKYTPLGAVFGKRIEAISLFRGFAAGIQGLFGGKIGMVEKKIQDATEGAKQDLLAQTLQQYPETKAIVGLQIHITDVGRDDSNQFLLVTAQGTAVGSKASQTGGKTRKNRSH